MAKQLKLEIARENPEAGNWLYADLQLPADEHEIRDAYQRARITSSDIFHQYQVYECEAIPMLPFRRLDAPTIDELNFLAKRLDGLNEEERLVLRAISPKIMKVGEDELVSMKDLINMTYGLDEVSIISNVRTPQQLGQFVIENDLHRDVEAVPEESLYLLDTKKIGELQQRNDGGVILPNMFQLSTVEKAKKNRQTATKIAPNFSPNTVPNAVWARLVLVITVLAAAAPISCRGPSRNNLSFCCTEIK